MRFETALSYDEFAYAQKFAATSLINLLKIHKQDFENIYEIGAGSGVLTKLILSTLNYQKITLNDLYKSEFMAKFETQIGDITSLNLPKVDLIISSSVFQWIDDLEALKNRLHASLKPNGILAFSMFCGGTLEELSSYTKQGLSYKNPNEIRQIFEDKFEVLSVKKDKFVVKFNSLKELLNHLKQTGVNNINGKFRLTKSSFKELENHFNGEFHLTYNFVNLICKKRELQ
ncbi:malonyl-[acp] methyltransferase [Campylobacter iguaniorum]|uniref:methyltransferase n=1 Tax=Campylobacter iguaniorum TaxID=1244531 RepID=UPI00073A1EA5|nr:methyltransferase [Campylobacter iguaniorum]ALV24095.1 malonyl-[acp] methyltransferase [Campylobacter iguaniorum]